MVVKMAMREAYAQTLVEVGAKYEDLIVLDADVSKSTRTVLFAEKYPERFINFGIAEQNMMAAAAGLATVGLLPFVNTFCFLATLRAGDQLRTSICYPNLNVKIAGSSAGLSNPLDGPTHHSVGDIAVVRGLPNMTVIVPADGIETKKALWAIMEHRGPLYLRLGRAETPLIYSEDYKFVLGKATTLRRGGDLTFIATGIMVGKCLEAAEELIKEGIEARIIDIHCLKPIDEKAIVKAAKETGAVVTTEEHNVVGGLGGAVAEVLARYAPVPMEIVGIRDTFAESGDYEGLLTKYGLSVKDLVKAARRVLKRKVVKKKRRR